MAAKFNARLHARSYSARAVSSTTTAKTSTPAKKQPDPQCAPACAECGLLECLCRPRFFAGQLLTERDLNRLDAYIRGKNRLHALQLHGSGVVNGLVVRCEPCGTGVIVGKGYAIGPCGDDIVVCNDVAVDVCALVQKCRPVDTSCTPYQSGNAKGCDDVIEDWILAIRYAETPTRGVTALRMGPSCTCGSSGGTCTCGASTSSGSCGCGTKAAKMSCGCGSTSGSTTTGTNGSCGCQTTKPRNASPECEPTAICEGYAFDVFPAPKQEQTPRDQKLEGALWQQAICCWQPLIDSIPPLPSAPDAAGFDANKNAWHLWCCRTKQAFVAYFSTTAVDCTLASTVSALTCPDPKSQSFAAQMAHMLNVFKKLAVDALLTCFCIALLPPAPCGTTEDRIPLALVRVRKKDCMVIDVCNWITLRKQVITFPALEYWLSLTPWPKTICDAVHALCCGRREQRPRTVGATYTTMSASAPADDSFAGAAEDAKLELNPTLSADVLADNATFADILSKAFARGDTPLEPDDVVGAMLGMDLGGAARLSDAERVNLPQFLALNEIVRPVVAGLMPSSGASGAVEDTASLKERVRVLEEAVAKMTTKG